MPKKQRKPDDSSEPKNSAELKTNNWQLTPEEKEHIRRTVNDLWDKMQKTKKTDKSQIFDQD